MKSEHAHSYTQDFFLIQSGHINRIILFEFSVWVIWMTLVCFMNNISLNFSPHKISFLFSLSLLLETLFCILTGSILLLLSLAKITKNKHVSWSKPDNSSLFPRIWCASEFICISLFYVKYFSDSYDGPLCYLVFMYIFRSIWYFCSIFVLNGWMKMNGRKC